MLNLICSDTVGVGKTGLMTALAINDATNEDKNSQRADAVKGLRDDGFNVTRNYYALYSNYKIHREFYKRNLDAIVIKNMQKVARLGDPDGIFLRPYSTLVVMEAQKEFNARKWQEFTPDQSAFFQTSRHYGIEIFLDSQDAENIEKTLRTLCRVIYVNSRKIYDGKGREVETADKYDLSRIEWDVTIYDRYRWYEKDVNGKKQKISIDYNIFDCYNPYENYYDYLPKNKKTLII